MNNTQPLTLTIESKLYLDSATLLEQFSGFYCHLEKKLFNDLVHAELVDNNLRKNLKKKYIAEHKIHSRLFNALWVETKAKFDALKEQYNQQRKSLDRKIKSTKEKIKKNSLRLKKCKSHESQRIKTSIHNMQQKLNRLQNQKGKPFKPSLVFGSRDYYKKQWDTEHVTWLSEWKRRCSNHFYLIGSKDESNGNQLCQYINKDGDETLQIRLPYFYEQKFINVPVRFYTDRKNKQYYDYFHEAVKQGVALNYRFLKRENGEWYVQVTFTIQKEYDVSCNGYIGVDINYNLIATSQTDRHGNLVAFKNYHYDSDGKTSEQVSDELSLYVKDIIQRAKESNCGLSIEKLDLENKRFDSGNKKSNRKVNAIEYGIIRSFIVSQCAKQSVELKIVNPAYTSIIGRYKYSKMYGLSVHTSAALVIARRAMYYKERIPIQMTCVLQRGEADKWATIYKHRHHWAHWAYLHKNLVTSLKRFNSVDGNAVSVNNLTVRFNPVKLSFLNRSSDKPMALVDFYSFV